MSKQKLLLITVLSLIVITMIGITSAYFATSERSHNVITTSGVTVELLETAVDANGHTVPFENITNAIPGNTYSKIPQVKNTDASDTWVRIRPIITASASDGSSLPVPDGALIINYDTTDWLKQGDYYYYHSALASDQLTTPLFTEVTIKSDLPDNYKNAKFNLTLSVGAVQSANNGTDVLSAEGWPEE